jgi:ribosomal protein S9
MEKLTLQSDTGADITFRGRLFSESSYFDEETGMMTRQRLYVTDQNQQVYSIVTSDGRRKERRVYLLKAEEGVCRINNGLYDVTVPVELLMLAVRGLCGLTESEQSTDFFAALEESLKAANA